MKNDFKFSAVLCLAGGLLGAGLGTAFAWHPLETMGAVGLGVLLGGALPLLRGIWLHVGVFLCGVAAFAWWMLHYVKLSP